MQKTLYSKLFLAIILFSTIIFFQNSTNGDEITNADKAETKVNETLLAMLEKAYQKKNMGLAVNFFDRWVEAIPSITEDELKHEDSVTKAAYEIYAIFFDPSNIDKIINDKWGAEDFFKNVPFYILQNTVHVRVVSKDETLYKKMIVNFRPRIEHAKSKKKIVYLTPEYEQVLLTFLDDEFYPVGTGNMMSPATAKGESAAKQDFLEAIVKIFHGHWQGWLLLTPPSVGTITFNAELTEAILDFGIIYEGGEAKFKKTDKGWQIVESGLLWVE